MQTFYLKKLNFNLLKSIFKTNYILVFPLILMFTSLQKAQSNADVILDEHYCEYKKVDFSKKYILSVTNGNANNIDQKKIDLENILYYIAVIKNVLSKYSLSELSDINPLNHELNDLEAEAINNISAFMEATRSFAKAKGVYHKDNVRLDRLEDFESHIKSSLLSISRAEFRAKMCD